MIKKAMILAAGFGTRIQPLTLKSPKPLLKIGNETLLSNTLKFLESFQIKQVVINVHYLGEQIVEYINKTKFNLSINIVKEKNEIFKEFAEKFIFNDIKSTLKNIGIIFDSFFNENTLYKNKDIYKIIEDLDKKELIYKKDGAIWFKGTKVGRENDRVLIKKTGEPTYRLPDMAYHIDKIKRDYDLCIDIFGADHMDAYPDVLEVVHQLGFDKSKIT